MEAPHLAPPAAATCRVLSERLLPSSSTRPLLPPSPPCRRPPSPPRRWRQRRSPSPLRPPAPAPPGAPLASTGWAVGLSVCSCGSPPFLLLLLLLVDVPPALLLTVFRPLPALQHCILLLQGSSQDAGDGGANDHPHPAGGGQDPRKVSCKAPLWRPPPRLAGGCTCLPLAAAGWMDLENGAGVWRQRCPCCRPQPCGGCGSTSTFTGSCRANLFAGTG